MSRSTRHISLHSATRAPAQRSGPPDLRRSRRYPYMSDVTVVPAALSPSAEPPAEGWAPPQHVDRPELVPAGCKPPFNEHFDMSANVAGAAARARRDEVNAQAPVRNLVARVLGVKTEERAWRVGAKGEEKVGKELTKLPLGWHVLHPVQVSDAGTDIDHVVIGPAGSSRSTRSHIPTARSPCTSGRSTRTGSKWTTCRSRAARRAAPHVNRPGDWRSSVERPMASAVDGTGNPLDWARSDRARAATAHPRGVPRDPPGRRIFGW